jgi:hypothetical protein
MESEVSNSVTIEGLNARLSVLEASDVRRSEAFSRDIAAKLAEIETVRLRALSDSKLALKELEVHFKCALLEAKRETENPKLQHVFSELQWFSSSVQKLLELESKAREAQHKQVISRLDALENKVETEIGKMYEYLHSAHDALHETQLELGEQLSSLQRDLQPSPTDPE